MAIDANAHVLRRQPVPLTLLDDVSVMASQARRSPLCGQRGRRRLRGQLGRQRILLVDGRVRAVRAVVVGGSAAAGCAAGITALTLLTWIVFAVAAWEGRGMVRFSGVDAVDCCVPTEGDRLGSRRNLRSRAGWSWRCVRIWLASSSVSVDRVLTAPSSSADARSITSADTPSSPANLCDIDHVCCSSSSVVASTVTACRSTQRPGAVRSSRSLPQFTIARGGESRTQMAAQRRRPEGKANCTRTHRWTMV